ncbi:MAG TPA: hypothetical protein VFK57_15705 [Vicinamibacterales bacterium]|nr:hypothetical protein [Vicinamibacterales bacterium]
MFDAQSIRRIALLAAVVAIAPAQAVAQLDKARQDPLSALRRNFEETSRYARDKNRTDAVKYLFLFEEALFKIRDLTRDVPAQLSNGGLPALAQKARELLIAQADLERADSQLRTKLERVSETYDSELSAFTTLYNDFLKKFNEVWEAFLRAGAAFKAACAECVR